MDEPVKGCTVTRKVAFVRHIKINVRPLVCITVGFLRTILPELNVLNNTTPLFARNDFHNS